MSIYRGYQPATRCTSGPTPGARALMAWYLGAYAARGGINTGIYNCRAVRGGATTSLHGEGRACDLGVRPYGAQWGTELADQLRLNSAELGIQLIIWNRRIWSGSYPNAGWRPYAGESPHLDHLHVELSRAAAAGLTPQHVAHVMAGQRATPDPPPPPPRREDDPAMRIDLTYYDDEGRPDPAGLNFRASCPVEVGTSSMVIRAAWVRWACYWGSMSHVRVVFWSTAGENGRPMGEADTGRYDYCQVPEGARGFTVEGRREHAGTTPSFVLLAQPH